MQRLCRADLSKTEMGPPGTALVPPCFDDTPYTRDNHSREQSPYCQSVLHPLKTAATNHQKGAEFAGDGEFGVPCIPIMDELEKDSPSDSLEVQRSSVEDSLIEKLTGGRGKYVRFVLAVLSSIPWVGGLLSVACPPKTRPK